MESEIEKIHDCEKCHDKMILIAFDGFTTKCGYCGEIIDYSPIWKAFWRKNQSDKAKEHWDKRKAWAQRIQAEREKLMK
jgi:hypothetical protein